MNNILSEKEYQKYILKNLAASGYEVQPADHYDRLFAVSRQELMRFLETTQPDEIKSLKKIYKEKTEEVIVSAINAEETKKRGSRLDVLKHGVEIANVPLKLMYAKPATTYNKELNKLYHENIFSVSEEVWASDEERIDLVVFLNGLAIIAFELKCNAAGQNYENAILQYRTERNPKTRLFRFKAGVLVSFAMDLEEVYMTTKLDGEATFFLPFNMGKGDGINTGAGNPVLKDEYSVHYMWDNILQKDSVLEIISKFMFIEVKEKKEDEKRAVKEGRAPRKKASETVIFPRFHQLDVIRKVLDDVMVNRSSQNYLLQHSAGSGKTNEIAWLSYRLASLHDDNNKIIFDSIIICTDRVVVDRQLQQAVLSLEHKSGFIRVMDEKCTSADLGRALEGNTKIVVTTIQKFPYIVGNVKALKEKHFAVIIDEAHSSTAGKNMKAVTDVLREGEEVDAEDILAKEVSKNGKPENVSVFAFTATPKPTTLKLFGRTNTKGRNEAFHLYSMKQAIEEGFILNVLENYTTYDTYFQLNKEIKEDPEYQTNKAKRQIARFIDLHETNIMQRVEIIIEHFRTTVMTELDGQAKAMVITASREAAVKYRQGFEDYVKRKGYTDIHALVAFSGKVKLEDKEYTEPGMNGFAEKKLSAEFDSDDYNVLIVADKYQTGFDQKKLCAMYILKKLHDVSTIQTLSRLNRICPPYDKHTFILDFVNNYDDIIKDFSKFYTVTELSNSITPAAMYDIEAKLDGYYVIDPDDVDKFNDLLYSGDISAKAKKNMTYLLQKTKKAIESHPTEERNTIILTVKHFVRFYEFLIQASCFEDKELHKKYNFLNYLKSYLKMGGSGGGFNLSGKIKASGFVQKKKEEHKTDVIKSDPVVKLPTAEQIALTPQKTEKLSQIIAEINSKTGKSYDNDVAVKAMLQIKDIMMKSEELKTSAKNNTEKDFEFAYFDNIDDALIEGLNQNQDFFSLLLGNDEIKKEVLGIFAEEIYRGLRAGE